MRVVGIDPGLATVGLGCIEANGTNFSNPEWLTINTKAGLSLSDRLLEIKQDLTEYLQETKPDLVAVEKLFFATNQKTALDVAQARGVIILCIAEAGLPLIEATPLQLKLGITGDGSAEKEQVQRMLVHMLGLSEIPQPDDAADALALAIYGALHHRTSQLSLQ